MDGCGVGREGTPGRDALTFLVVEGWKVPERIDSLKSFLIQYFGQKAEFRNSLSGDDREWLPKNECYARSIDMLVEYLSELPDDDETLLKLDEALYDPTAIDGVHEFPRTERGEPALFESEAIHFGPRGQTIKPEDIPGSFQSWAGYVLEHAREYKANGGYEGWAQRQGL